MEQASARFQPLTLAVKRVGVEQMLLEVENYWSAWLNRIKLDLNVLPKEVARLYKRSLLFMRAHIDNHGGFLASLDSDILGVHRRHLFVCLAQRRRYGSLSLHQRRLHRCDNQVL